MISMDAHLSQPDPGRASALPPGVSRDTFLRILVECAISCLDRKPKNLDYLLFDNIMIGACILKTLGEGQLVARSLTFQNEARSYQDMPSAIKMRDGMLVSLLGVNDWDGFLDEFSKAKIMENPDLLHSSEWAWFGPPINRNLVKSLDILEPDKMRLCDQIMTEVNARMLLLASDNVAPTFRSSSPRL